MRWTLLLALAACGSKKEAPAVTPPAEASVAAVVVDAGTAPATDAAVVATPPAAIGNCTDGGSVSSFGVKDNDLRYCIEDNDKKTTCWRVSVEHQAIYPLDPATAMTGVTAFALADTEVDPPKPPWTSEVFQSKDVKVCGPEGCKPFAYVQTKNPDDDMNAVSAVEVSESGKHVALVRGWEGVGRETIEIYDRETGKRTGVARPKSRCVTMQRFAGETLVAAEWDCANYGGDRILVGTTGKILGRSNQLAQAIDPVAQIDGDRWAFWETATAALDIYDVVTGKRFVANELEQGAAIAVAGGRVYAIEPTAARAFVFDRDGTNLVAVRAPVCRWEWEEESFGPLKIRMTDAELAKAMGPAKTKTKPDVEYYGSTTWTYASGVLVEIHPLAVNDENRPVPPWNVVGFMISAPSKITFHGIGIGSTPEELRAALGEREIKGTTVEGAIFIGNSDTDAISFEFVDGKVAHIRVGDLREDSPQ